MDFNKAIELINAANSVLITTHARPDGDACGSVAALAEGLMTVGKKVQSLMLTEIPQWYEFLFEKKPSILGQDSIEDFDLIIIADTNSYNQLDAFASQIKDCNKPILVFDHHVTGDNLGAVELVDTTAAAAGLIVYDFIKFAKWGITPTIARALFVAIATDTGWFKFDNTDSRVHLACAELVAVGVDTASIYHDLHQNFSIARFKLLSAMLDNLQIYFDGKYACQYITQDDFKTTGATGKDTENLIDECQKIATVEVAALFVELADGRVKCSLRSRGQLDVRQIAEQFQGGGHSKASGLHLDGPLEEAMKTIYHIVEQQMATGKTTNCN